MYIFFPSRPLKSQGTPSVLASLEMGMGGCFDTVIRCGSLINWDSCVHLVTPLNGSREVPVSERTSSVKMLKWNSGLVLFLYYFYFMHIII